MEENNPNADRIFLFVSRHSEDIAVIDVSEDRKTARIFIRDNGYKDVSISDDSALAAIVNACKELK